MHPGYSHSGMYVPGVGARPDAISYDVVVYIVPFRITIKGTYDTTYIPFVCFTPAHRTRYSWLSKKPMPVLRTLPTKTSYHLAIMAIGTTLSGVIGPPPMKPET